MLKVSLLTGLITLAFVMGCNSKNGSDKPFNDILSKPPFSGLTDSISAEPGNDSLYFRRAVLLNSNNFPGPALMDFKKAWSIRKNEQYAYGIANLLLEKQPDSAILFINSALVDLPQSFLLQLTLAKALVTQNKAAEALVIAENMQQQNPQQVDVLKMKADILDRLEKKGEAISTLEKAYALTPFDVELNYMLALRLAESGNPRVISLCDSLIRADSLGIHAEPYYYKGIYYATVNDKTRAITLFDDAIKKNIYFLDGYIEKGAILYELKRYPEALGVFNLCLTVSPKFADAYYWIAKTQEAMGRKQEARVNYERAYSLDKTNTEAKAAADKLK